MLLGVEPAALACIISKPQTAKMWEISPECQRRRNTSTCGKYIWKVKLLQASPKKTEKQEGNVSTEAHYSSHRGHTCSAAPA